MLKKFFISMLGTIAGLWISAILFVLCSFIGVAMLLSKSIADTPVKKSSILLVDLSGVIDERQSEMTMADLLQGTVSNGSVSDIVTAIRLAADDKKIKGLFLDCVGSEMGVASRGEVMDAIQYFKDSGKWVYAYGDNYMQGDYYIATTADKVFLNPVGSVTVHGVGVTTMFYADLLEKVGVKVQVVKVGSFKSAVEPFIRNDMSEPSKLQTSIFVNQIWDEIRGRIAENRNVSIDSVDNWANKMSFTWAPELCMSQRMVDGLKYRVEVENMMRDKLGLKKNEDLPFVSTTDYMSQRIEKLGNIGKKHIAVLYAVGDIVDDGLGGIVATQIVPQIYQLAEDKNVKGLVLRVNSGGGSAFASEQIWHALEDFKATGKPFYVSMGDYAASGGYYISCGADMIYADATTLTGSIGIFGLIPEASELLNKKLGVHFETVQSNANADFPALYQPGTPEQMAAMQQYVERGYETFVSRVAEGRGISVDSVKVIGGGRVWDGVSALNIGLVDDIANLNIVVEDMADELGLKSSDVVSYPIKTNTWLDSFMSQSEFAHGRATIVDEMFKQYMLAKSVTEMNLLQARMEPMRVE